jgi:HK97 family phage portal protein
MSNQRSLLQKMLNIPSPAERKIVQEIEKRGGFEVVLEALKSNRLSAQGSVTPGTSMQVAAVYACVRLISETIASLPLFLYEEKDGEKRRAKDHYLYPILHDQANPLMTAMEYWETTQGHKELWGNSYSQLIYDERGRITEIWPLRPDRMIEIKVVGDQKYFYYQPDSGGAVWLTDNEVWHETGLSSNGIIGYSPIWLMRKTVALAMDAEDFGSRFFLNDARPGIIIEHPNTLSDPAFKHLKQSLDEDHAGVLNSHKPMILEEGMKLHEVGIPPGDAQFLETRQFQVREIARIFRVQPHMIMDLQQATFSNIEHQAIDFVVHCIRPRLVKREQSIRAHLLLPSERNRYYAEHLVDGLLRGDTLSRYQAYGYAKQWGFMSTNDIRRMENMNTVAGGDVYLSPLNYTNQQEIGKTPRSIDAGEEIVNNSKALRELLSVLYGDAMARVIKREVQDLRMLAKKQLINDDSEKFRNACIDFYKSHMEWVKRQLLPIFTSVRMISAESIPDIDLLVAEFGKTYEQKALESINSALNSAKNEGKGLSEAFDSELDGWKESRVDLVVGEETRLIMIN